ncbi:hypothetical protein ACFSVJ_12685 [Prauserella oleivorans]
MAGIGRTSLRAASLVGESADPPPQAVVRASKAVAANATVNFLRTGFNSFVVGECDGSVVRA